MMTPEQEAFLEELLVERRAEFHPTTRDDLPRDYLLKAQCKYFSHQFAKKFPNLRVQGGFYGQPYSDDAEPDFSYVEHWWCVDENGNIVDPTVEQFGNRNLTYTPYDPDVHRINIGRCANCGDYIYGLKKDGPASVCGSECETALANYYNSI